MLLQPPVIALLVAAAANVLLVAGVTPFAVSVLRHWDLSSGSARQLALERQTYLVSTIVAFVLTVQLVAVLLSVFTADRLAVMFVGAMCAVGTFHVNAYGMPALAAGIAVFFGAAIWLAVNHADVQAPDYPLVRAKYGLLLVLMPLLLAAAVLQSRFVLGLHADVITSCCSRTFSSRAAGLSGDMAAWPPAPALGVFFGSLAVVTLVAAYSAIRRRGGYLLAGASVIAGIAGVAGVIAAISVYVYEQPLHHCPFCLLKSDYGYVGYALYVPLFGATAAGLSAGAVQACARMPSMHLVAPRLVGILARWSATGFATVALVALFLIARSHLVLFGPSHPGVTP